MNNFDLGIRGDGGLTHVLDKGLGPRGWEDVLEMAGEHIDIVKLGWGTAYVTNNLERKLEVLKEKRVVIGGTFFEVVYVRVDSEPGRGSTFTLHFPLYAGETYGDQTHTGDRGRASDVARSA